MASQGTFTSHNSITNPRIPFNTEIPGGLSTGYRIIIKGYVASKPNQFAINLFSSNGDHAFHLNPRFKQKEVVRNANHGGWGIEEKDGGFPFEAKREFDLIILVESSHFNVTVNASHLFDFKHRANFRDIKRLGIDGDVECRHISFVGIGAGKGLEVYNPVAGTYPLSGFVRTGTLIQVTGTIKETAETFAINLQSGPKPQNIAFHFNPRWGDKSNPHQVTVVRNSSINGSWGEEERNAPTFPISRGAKFEMLILNDSNEWKIAFNGKHFIAFKHRISSDLVDYIGFHGDIDVISVKQY